MGDPKVPIHMAAGVGVRLIVQPLVYHKFKIDSIITSVVYQNLKFREMPQCKAMLK